MFAPAFLSLSGLLTQQRQRKSHTCKRRWPGRKCASVSALVDTPRALSDRLPVAADGGQESASGL
uniref:Uncharacterized protein n=1 Tax=Amphiprion ocellaris TaxID=80972 RepID=A0AAQ5ZW89_AMPOC